MPAKPGLSHPNQTMRLNVEHPLPRLPESRTGSKAGGREMEAEREQKSRGDERILQRLQGTTRKVLWRRRDWNVGGFTRSVALPILGG
ncbi:hypothetical protein AVEN_243470-1 [Araneus ventricosus]|uniref:Uncharacterized protein n=1 Tax=Araneus ventricosus TaxID=182803 RepID=A0A4Y2SCP0_ARAVE|nr:hypothetical protein AVEN_243470-1 [Araneus ventricosus]